MERRIIIGGLFGLALLFILLGFRSHPFALKKQAVKITFKKSIVSPEPFHLRATIYGKTTGEVIATGIRGVIVIGMIILIIHFADPQIYGGLVGSLGGFVFSLQKVKHELQIYDNAIVEIDFFKHHIYLFTEDTTIETYNIVNSFNRGVAFGYCLKSDGKNVVQFTSREFIKLEQLEEILEQHPLVNKIEKIGI